MNEQALLQRLEDHHHEILEGLDVIRRHCEASVPDSRGLAVARSRLTKVSLARSAFVAEMIVPHLSQDGDVELRTRLLELSCKSTAKRQISTEHVAMWTSATIEEDWAGYCAAARLIWAMMEDQIEMERRYLIDRMRERSQ